MTPEQIRRILDPERRRKGHEAWKAEQREKARAGFEPAPSPLHEGSSTAGVQPLVELPRHGESSTALAHPGEVEAATNPWVATWPSSLRTDPYVRHMDCLDTYKSRGFWEQDIARRLHAGQRSGKTSASKSVFEVEVQRAHDAAEAELREALGELVAIDVAASSLCGHRPKVVTVQRCEASASFRVRLRSATWPGDLSSATAYTQNPDPTMARLDWLLRPASDEGEGCYEAEAQVSDEWALTRLRRTLGDGCLAALQPKLEVRDGVAIITRKTLRKDGGA